MRAEEEIRIERENAADEIRRQIVEISTLMASRFVQVSIDHDTQDKYIDEALADWSERTWQA
jgi:F-type H+-transporting ATPase subunit b